MPRPAATPTAIIGSGRLARSLLPLLGPAGYPVAAVAGRRLARARAATQGIRGARATTSLRVALDTARLVLLAVPDRSISTVSRKLAGLRRIDWHDRIVLHHAGALGVEPLAPLARAGAAVGVLHPLQSLADPKLGRALLPGSAARVEGDRKGRAAAVRLARALRLVPLRLSEPMTDGDRTAYHAAASLLSNDLLGLLAIGVELLESIGLDRGEALAALVALSRGTLSQVEAAGLAGALTGPVARGDAATLDAHLRRLAARSKPDAEVHRLLSGRLVRLAAERGDRRAVRSIERLLASRPQRAGV